MADETEQHHAIDTMLLEERTYPPSQDFAAQANAKPDIYDVPFEDFWEREGRERVTWFEPFSDLYQWEPPYAKWYLGGKLNVCFNCVDRHVEAGAGEKLADERPVWGCLEVLDHVRLDAGVADHRQRVA